VPVAQWYDITGEQTVGDIQYCSVHHAHGIEWQGQSLRKKLPGKQNQLVELEY